MDFLASDNLLFKIYLHLQLRSLFVQFPNEINFLLYWKKIYVKETVEIKSQSFLLARAYKRTSQGNVGERQGMRAAVEGLFSRWGVVHLRDPYFTIWPGGGRQVRGGL